MSKMANVLASLLVLCTGCAAPTGQGARQEPPRDWELPGAKGPSLPAPFAAAIPTSPSTSLSVPPLAASPLPVPTPEATWSSLSRWSQQRGLGVPRRLTVAPLESYGVQTSSGELVVSIGSRSAYWDGLEFRLGFTPQLIDGEVFLHTLDVRKNLEPLLLGPAALSTPGGVIVLDPGHGGANTGAQSALDGRWEKEFTLDWARRLAPLLETNGWKVFLTRTSDVTVSNSDRVSFTEARHGDLFISLHFNSTADRDKRTGGLETYCLTPTGMPSTLTRGFADPWDENLPNNRFDAQNLQLAFRVHRALLRATGLEDRGVRRSRFLTVLRGQKCPAILIEGGYLSNPHEAALIADPAYRQVLALAVAKAIWTAPEAGGQRSEAGNQQSEGGAPASDLRPPASKFTTNSSSP